VFLPTYKKHVPSERVYILKKVESLRKKDGENSLLKEAMIVHLRKKVKPLWFATEKSGEQLSDFGDGKGVPDTIYYGLVQGFEGEWEYLSPAEIESLRPKTWEIKKRDLVYAGRRKQ
jgi:hypothetical protein